MFSKHASIVLGFFSCCCVLVCAAYLHHKPEAVEALVVTRFNAGVLRERLASFWAFATHVTEMDRVEKLRLLKEENEWKNSLVMWIFPTTAQESLPHVVQTWLRCWILCMAVYFIVGILWSYYLYWCLADIVMKPGTVPTMGPILEQVKVSMLSMPMYSLIPVFAEWAAEMGYTHAYPRIANVGMLRYVVYLFLYMTLVEFGIYWMHRGLHEIKWAYKYIHYPHHKYNKEHTLSPFAGLAFHPLDGMCQASPYALAQFICPVHFLTLEMLLFATGIWTANIHDCVHANVRPIMGAGYHTIHHTTYKHNYGQYFTFMDALFGTLQTPEEYEEGTKLD